MYPIMKWFHFVGLSLWLGTILIVDMRLMEIGPRRQSAAALSDGLRAWKWIGFVVAFLSGFLLFSVEAANYVSNAGFRLKLAVFPIALLWHVVVQRNTPAWTHGERVSAMGKWAGGIEVVVWAVVVAGSVGFLLTNALTYP